MFSFGFQPNSSNPALHKVNKELKREAIDMYSSDKFKIFSCDGGGFRGYLTSLILERIEKKLNNEIAAVQTKNNASNQKLGDYFEMYAGTSTGALIACGLAFGLSAQEIKNIYDKHGEKIFPNLNIWKELQYRAAQFLSAFTIQRLTGMTSEHRFWSSKPLFDGTELQKAIENVFGQDTRLGDFAHNKRIIITAYDVWNSLPVIFDNQNEEHQSLKIVDILLASAAYPGGFPAHSISDPSFIKHQAKLGSSKPNYDGFPLVDGGLVANNPALLALAEYCKYKKNNPQIPDAVILATFGTGKLALRFNLNQTKTMGLLDWTFPFGNPLLEVIFGGYSRLTDNIASSLLLDYINKDGIDNYFRFQPYIQTVENQSSTVSSNLYPITLPDSVFITPQEQKQFESATFQHSSKNVLAKIADKYLTEKPEDSNPPLNQEMQVSQRIDKLVRSLL
ncbi:MAG: patatin-like phospholipase family protein [Hassallia sp. WJT32-NPBG1]|jgi:patatin-like phospholipase/acyl hydrolase|nr:patatin-like phospholipase family protein [Hassallia sp. WJT32-NPBG1]